VDGDTDGFTITENHIHDSDNIGIDAVGYWGTGPTGYDHARNGLISRNTLYNLSSLHNPSYAKYAADGIYCDGCSNTIIERNLVYACDQNISASSEIYGQVSSYVTIRNNVLYAANMTGISIGGYTTAGGSDHVVIVNNTILHNTNVGWATVFTSRLTQLIIFLKTTSWTPPFPAHCSSVEPASPANL
jgi:polygalacturonase